MATSGSVDFSVNRDEIIYEAMELIGVKGVDQTPTANDIATCSRTLNLLVKQWQSNTDFAPGLKAWSRKRATLLLQKDQYEYSLGPSGDNWTSSYVRTTLTDDEATSSVSISVNSTSGISGGDYVGVELDSGEIHWTTVNGAPGGGVVTLTSGLSSNATEGNYLWAYTAKARRPIRMLTAALRDRNNNDTPLKFMSLEEYESLPKKGQPGDPGRLFYEPTLSTGTVYLDVSPSDTTKVIRVVYLAAIEDFDAINDTPDYPQEWFKALCWGLARDIWPKFWTSKKWPDDYERRYIETLAIARQSNPENSTLFFEPNR